MLAIKHDIEITCTTTVEATAVVAKVVERGGVVVTHQNALHTGPGMRVMVTAGGKVVRIGTDVVTDLAGLGSLPI